MNTTHSNSNPETDFDEPPAAPQAKSVHISAGGMSLAGDLVIPSGATGIVLFAHGSGSSRYSPRNQFVARRIHHAGIATLLFDLLTHEEEIEDASRGYLRFDISLLTERLVYATRWARRQHETRHLPIGYFGASTGAAAALAAAAEMGTVIKAVVSRGGRPDLALKHLAAVRAATLLIVGERDEIVLRMNEQAFEHLFCEKQLAVVPHATHLFEERGALEEVASLAANWFEHHLIEKTK